MAAGDASRTWFSEMVETLRREWKPDMLWEEIIALRDRLDAMLQQIRLSRGIRPPSKGRNALAVCGAETDDLIRKIGDLCSPRELDQWSEAEISRSHDREMILENNPRLRHRLGQPTPPREHSA